MTRRRLRSLTALLAASGDPLLLLAVTVHCATRASGDPLLLLAVTVHCATIDAIREARKQLFSWQGIKGSYSDFQLGVPATMSVVKELCGLDNVDMYLQSLLSSNEVAV